MKRTQIYIDERTYIRLEENSKAIGTSVSEFIRQSIREKLNKRNSKILKAADVVFGMWKTRKFNVDEYIRKSRQDRNI